MLLNISRRNFGEFRVRTDEWSVTAQLRASAASDDHLTASAPHDAAATTAIASAATSPRRIGRSASGAAATLASSTASAGAAAARSASSKTASAASWCRARQASKPAGYDVTSARGAADAGRSLAAASTDKLARLAVTVTVAPPSAIVSRT